MPLSHSAERVFKACIRARRVSAIFFCGIATSLCVLAAGLRPAYAVENDGDNAAWRPGYRYIQYYFEDNRRLNGFGGDVAWAAIHPRGFEIDVGTGFRFLTRHEDSYVLSGWTAFIGITAPSDVAPYAEIGFDLGEALGELLIDTVLEDRPEQNWTEPDTFMAVGLRISVTQRAALKIYYKQQFVESERYRELGSEMLGIAFIYRYPRVRLEWWQYPL